MQKKNHNIKCYFKYTKTTKHTVSRSQKSLQRHRSEERSTGPNLRVMNDLNVHL